MRPITIIGGGLAGLTLGILLRRRDVPVELWEAAGYPRHRVCGEFISGAGARLLPELFDGEEPLMRPARTVRFHTKSGSTGIIELPEPGLAVSRWSLDARLAQSFVRKGGRLFTKRRWTEPLDREGIVRASGRRIESNGHGWNGLKVHLQDLEPEADLEMHFSDLGYVGISRLPEGANVCALVRAGCDISTFRSDPRSFFRKMLSNKAAEKVASAQIDTASACAVSGISFSPNPRAGECSVGDAIRMIPPFTGNGMSLAIESGFLASEPLIAYSVGSVNWADTVQEVKDREARAFRRRFATSSILRSFSGGSWRRAVMLSSLRTVPRLLSIFFTCTR